MKQGMLSGPDQTEWFAATPKALASFSPGLERSDYPGITNHVIILCNAEGVA